MWGCFCVVITIVIFTMLIFSIGIFSFFLNIIDIKSLTELWDLYYTYIILAMKLIFIGFGGLLVIGNQLIAAKKIIEAKVHNEREQDINLIKKNLKEIFKCIIANLFALFCMYKCYIFFNSEIFKIAFSLYICIIIGFAASFPLERDSAYLLYGDEEKLMKRNFANTGLLFSSYLIYHYEIYKKYIPI